MLNFLERLTLVFIASQAATYTKRVAKQGLFLGIVCLSGCEWMGMYEKEKWIAATSRPGWDTFTFKGQLPAKFGIDAIAFYGPNEPDKSSCQTVAFYEPGKTVTRHHIEEYTAEIKAQPQGFSFEIPLSYYKGLCGMSLGRVKLEINVRYGDEKWQKTYANGNLFISKAANDDTTAFPSSGKLDITTQCSFTFQESKLNFGIDKFMRCRSARVDFPRSELINKTINLKVEVNPEERPSMRNRWIKTDTGWVPCQPTEKSDRCQTPPTFKTFKMNGRTCTVYPSCKE
ncbi:hypothetical protein [Pseudomonas syringae]|uniref:hypothetical protein n=1 Tax=Pseudomonas syringae TaxID=317 RepID=UPI000A598B95|nr:hypothetical protein [Pseudomonas syringae]